VAKSKGILISNAGLKLVSLALALMLEFYFYSQDNSTTQSISASLEFQNVPLNRLIIDPAHAEEGLPARVEVSGPKSIVRQIAQGFHVVKVPFPEKAAFTFPIDIHYESLQLPPSVKIVSAKPARLTIRTVELVRKEVPIEVPTEGLLPEGYEIKSINVFPNTVIARGPLNEIQKLEVNKLEPLNLTGLTEPFSKFELRLKSPGEFTTLDVNLVSVEVTISEKIVTKEVNFSPINEDSNILGLGKKFQFSPNTVKVTLKGKLSDLENAIKKLKVKPNQKLEKSTKKVLLVAEVMDGVEVEKISPSEVSAKLVE